MSKKKPTMREQIAELEAELAGCEVRIEELEEENAALQRSIEDQYFRALRELRDAFRAAGVDDSISAADGIRSLVDNIEAFRAHAAESEREARVLREERDAVAMMLDDALSYAEKGDITASVLILGKAAQRCPPVEEARERTRKAAELFDQILHPNGRCECAGEGLCDWCSKECEMCGTQRCTGFGCDSECLGCRDYAERVAELEAERDALRRVVAAVREVVK